MAKETNYAVIIAGGGGTRLWPLSVASKPKQFLKLFDNKSLLRQTFERLHDVFPIQNIMIVTSEKLASEVQKEIPELSEANIVGEPSPKNTTAAIWLAAQKINEKEPSAVFSTFAADHYIKGKENFLNTLRASQEAASKGDYIVTIGIQPTNAHTGFGYIHVDGERFKVDGKSVFKIKGFKEKPDKHVARAYFASGEYFWNANINSYKVSTLLKAVKKFVPEIGKLAAEKIKDRDNLITIWNKLPEVPIDTAILEKANNVLMIPGSFSWHDVGNWDVIYSLLSTKKGQNVVLNQNSSHIEVDSNGCLIYTDQGVVVTFGLEDLIIIKTGDRVAVFPRSRAEDIKKIVEKFRKEKKDKFL